MARRREIHPDFFVDPKVLRMEPLERLFFIGLWCHADKLGVLIDDPDGLAVRILPREAAFDADRALARMAELGLILRFVHPDFDRPLVWIAHFTRYQRPHPREAASGFPLPPKRKLPESGQGLPKVSQGEPGAGNSGRAFQAFQAFEPSKSTTDLDRAPAPVLVAVPEPPSSPNERKPPHAARSADRQTERQKAGRPALAVAPSPAALDWLRGADDRRKALGREGPDPRPSPKQLAVLEWALAEFGPEKLTRAHEFWLADRNIDAHRDGSRTRVFLTKANITEQIGQMPPATAPEPPPPCCARCDSDEQIVTSGGGLVSTFGPRAEPLCRDCYAVIPENSWLPAVWEAWLRSAAQPNGAALRH